MTVVRYDIQVLIFITLKRNFWLNLNHVNDPTHTEIGRL